MNLQRYDVLQAVVYGPWGLGWMLAIVATAGVRTGLQAAGPRFRADPVRTVRRLVSGHHSLREGLGEAAHSGHPHRTTAANFSPNSRQA